MSRPKWWRRAGVADYAETMKEQNAMTSYTNLKARLRSQAGRWVDVKPRGIVWALDDLGILREALVAIEELEQRVAAQSMGNPAGQLLAEAPASQAVGASGPVGLPARYVPITAGEPPAQSAPAPAAEPACVNVSLSAMDNLTRHLGYIRWWEYNGALHFERPGKPGYIEVLRYDQIAAPQPAQADEGREQYEQWRICAEAKELARRFEEFADDAEQHALVMVPIDRGTLKKAAYLLRACAAQVKARK